MLVSSIEYSPYLGRLGIGKITQGTMATNAEIAVVRRDGGLIPARVTRIYRFRGNEREATDAAGCGEIVAVAGMDEVTVGVTYTDPEDPAPLPPMDIDPPTLSMNFIANDSPFAGREGTYVTSTHLAERLRREVLSDVALHVEDLEDGSGYRVSGRGELHLSILIERMRREGYEFQVTSPRAIILEDEGGRQEPYEDLTIDVDERFVGGVIESLGARKGQMLSMENEGGMIRLLYRIPTRGLLGFRSQFLTDTKGMGVMNYVFAEYGPYAGEIRTRRNGAMVSMATGATVGYALFNLQERGRLFLGPGEPVYTGQVIGEHCRTGDLTVNPCKGKKLTNMRASGSDENVILTPPVRMALEICLSFINDDELVELTPKAIRLRKIRGRTKP
jgi:GTP-binding protein